VATISQPREYQWRFDVTEPLWSQHGGRFPTVDEAEVLAASIKTGPVEYVEMGLHRMVVEEDAPSEMTAEQVAALTLLADSVERSGEQLTKLARQMRKSALDVYYIARER
jgi:biotin synthase-related radical SAM superfamily protein